MEKKIQTFLESKSLKITLCVLGGIVLCLCIFQAGVVVGYQKAEYSYHFGENYFSMFGHEHGGPGLGLPPNGSDDIVGGHGASGKVVRLDGSTLVIEDSSNIEKIVTIEPATIIRSMRDTVTASAIMPNDSVIVFGTPDQSGAIEANLIRIFPTAPNTSDSDATSTATSISDPGAASGTSPAPAPQQPVTTTNNAQ